MLRYIEGHNVRASAKIRHSNLEVHLFGAFFE
jgi:hypothetical protein